MKMTTEHRETLRERIAQLDTDDTRTAYREGRYPRSERTKDVNVRYRWDLFWAAGGAAIATEGDYKDTHIDTALRSIVTPL